MRSKDSVPRPPPHAWSGLVLSCLTLFPSTKRIFLQGALLIGWGAGNLPRCSAHWLRGDHPAQVLCSLAEGNHLAQVRCSLAEGDCHAQSNFKS